MTAIGGVLQGGTLIANGMAGAIEGTVERTLNGEETTWEQLKFDFAISALTGGVLDGVGRAFSKRAAKKLADKAAKELAEKVAKEAAEKVTEEITDGLSDGLKYEIAAKIARDADDIVAKMSRELDILEAEEYAFKAIKGWGNSENVVLGKFEEGLSSSYDKIAERFDAQYFNLDNWGELNALYTRKEIWKINERFLDIQTSSGREIYLSHNPKDYINDGSYYADELNYLKNNKYSFIKEGDLWHAVR